MDGLTLPIALFPCFAVDTQLHSGDPYRSTQWDWSCSAQGENLIPNCMDFSS